jgi:hypothetical protein
MTLGSPLVSPMRSDPFIREKFTKERTAARTFAQEYFEKYPKDRYQTEVESWHHLVLLSQKVAVLAFEESDIGGDSHQRDGG